MRESSLASLIIIIAAITTFLFLFLSFFQKEQGWLGVAAGFLAVEGVFCYFSNYFILSESEESATPANPFVKRIVGIIGIAAGILWIFSAWPGLFFKN